MLVSSTSYHVQASKQNWEISNRKHTEMKTCLMSVPQYGGGGERNFYPRGF